jgi:hypothetical protein
VCYLQSSQELSRNLAFISCCTFLFVLQIVTTAFVVCIQEVIVQPMDIVRVLIEVSYDVYLSYMSVIIFD